MSGYITAARLRSMLDAGLNDDQVMLVAEATECRGDLAEAFQHVMGTMQEAGEPSAKIAAAVMVVAEAYAEREGRKRRRYPPSEIEPSDYPCGPSERWGYDGPVTPRLPDREWWPLRNAVLDDADWTCFYCGDRHGSMCADHVVPLSRGGTNERDNLVCACIPCNSSKCDRLLSEWEGRYR